MNFTGKIVHQSVSSVLLRNITYAKQEKYFSMNLSNHVQIQVIPKVNRKILVSRYDWMDKKFNVMSACLIDFLVLIHWFISLINLKFLTIRYLIWGIHTTRRRSLLQFIHPFRHIVFAFINFTTFCVIHVEYWIYYLKFAYVYIYMYVWSRS